MICMAAMCVITAAAKKPDSLERYKFRCDSLERRCDSLRTECKILKEKYDSLQKKMNLPVKKDSDKIDSLQRILNDFSPVREMLADSIVARYRDYPDYEFSKQKLEELDSILNLANILKSEKLAGLAAKTEKARKLKIEYDSLYRIVNSAYNKDLIEPARSRANTLLSECISPQKKKEVERLITALKLYPQAVIKVKEIVEWIHGTMELYRPSGNPSAAKNSLSSILTNQSDVINSVVNKVPYLKGCFEKLVDELKKNPIKEGTVEKELIESVKQM